MPRRDGTHPWRVTCNPHLLSATSGRLTGRTPPRVIRHPSARYKCEPIVNPCPHVRYCRAADTHEYTRARERDYVALRRAPRSGLQPKAGEVARVRDKPRLVCRRRRLPLVLRPLPPPPFLPFRRTRSSLVTDDPSRTKRRAPEVSALWRARAKQTCSNNHTSTRITRQSGAAPLRAAPVSSPLFSLLAFVFPFLFLCFLRPSRILARDSWSFGESRAPPSLHRGWSRREGEGTHEASAAGAPFAADFLIRSDDARAR